MQIHNFHLLPAGAAADALRCACLWLFLKLPPSAPLLFDFFLLFFSPLLCFFFFFFFFFDLSE